MSGPKKTSFTKFRKPLVAVWPETKELETKWSKYCFVPLDIPILGDKVIAEWLLQHIKPTFQIKGDVAAYPDAPGAPPRFNSVDVRLTGTLNHGIWSVNKDHNFLEEFPYFHEQMMDTLPFNTITSWQFWQSNKLIEPHRDQQDFRDFPNGFRSMIYDTNPMSTLFLREVLPDATNIVPGTQNFLPRLTETNSFVWNNLRMEHASVYIKKCTKILLIINNKDINVDKYNKLMERSISKYSEYVKISEYQTSDYIDL